jgi:hypothetical protein
MSDYILDAGRLALRLPWADVRSREAVGGFGDFMLHVAVRASALQVRLKGSRHWAAQIVNGALRLYLNV